jgi:hypothetical protein
MSSIEVKTFSEAEEINTSFNNAKIEAVNAGDAYSIEPGHDAWVVGDDVAEAFEFAGLWGE